MFSPSQERIFVRIITMAKKKNIFWIGFLMSVSQVLLTVFVVQWLFAQFNEDKEVLKKNLLQQFVNAKQQVTDSMLVETLINPILHGEKGFKVRLDIENDSNVEDPIPASNEVRKFILSSDRSDSGKAISRKAFDRMITIHHTEDPKNKTLLQGVKLIYKELSSVSGDSDMIKKQFSLKTDTMLFKKILSENLNQGELKFNMHWYSGKENDSSGRKKSTIYFESNLFPTPYGVAITQYNGYLVKKMTPQFLFGLILLLLTGAAFLIAYRSLKEQMRMNELRNDFISNISHELKTPVSTVKVAIEALKDFDMKKDPDVANEYLEIATLEMDRLDLLISKVLNTSMLENGKQLVQPERMNLKTVVEEVVASLQMRCHQQHALVNVEYPEKEMIVDADTLHVSGVLLNLLDNSLKYGNENPEITISLTDAGESFKLTISDNGPGIPDEYKSKIFEKFFRIPTGNRHNVKGYGLGLSYAALVMEQHGGNINVQNRDEGGCVFTLTFPKS